MSTDITEVQPAGAQLDAVVPARSRHLGLALVVISMAQLMLVLDELIVNAGLSLIAVTFPEGKLRTRALGMYAAMTGLGGGVGVVAGGLLTTYASWRWVFFVNVPIGLL